MKKIYLHCVYKNNLGDDLFIKILCERYKDTVFNLITCENFNIKPQLPNLKVKKINKLFYKICRKICYILKIRNVIDTYYINKCDYVVTIGGSMFMENKNQHVKNNFPLMWYKNLRKKHYILGANIGPTYTEEYIKYIKENVLNKAIDVCLRDKKSYEKVNDLDNVRLASDIVFSLDVNKYNIQKNYKKVIISVINCKKKSEQLKNISYEEYEKLILNLIYYFREEGYTIELFSFCKNEGDEQVIDDILEKVKNKDGILTYRYDGNIENALHELALSEIIIGTRFHANILGLLLEKTIIPISYNDKTINMLNDINFEGKKFNLEDTNSINPISLSDVDLSYKCDISLQKNDANNHFKKLDEVLNRKEKNE